MREDAVVSPSEHYLYCPPLDSLWVLLYSPVEASPTILSGPIRYIDVIHLRGEVAMQDQVVQRNFQHVSYTEAGWQTDPWKLLDAAARWRPMDSITIERFDVDGFQELHGLPSDWVSTAEGNLETRIMATMTHDSFRKGPIEHTTMKGGDVAQQIQKAVSKGTAIDIVLPSFAGRPHNPAAHRRVAPDLGELYALQRLKNICDAVRRVYPPGLTFTLILDGRAYRPFYGYMHDEAVPYGANLTNQIGLIDAEDEIRMVDMWDLMCRYEEELADIDEAVREKVANDWKTGAFSDRGNLTRALRQGVETVAISSAVIELYKSGGSSGVDLVEYFRRAEEVIDQRAQHTALEYAVLMTKLREVQVIRRSFPDSVRGTVHPKPGQYSPRLSDPRTTISPWHGVPVVRSDASIVTVYEAAIYQDFERYEAVFLSGDEAPFYYRDRASGSSPF